MGALSDFLSSADFFGFIINLQNGGWFEFAFPFLLVYAIVFTILEKVDLFTNKKPVRIIISVIFAFFAIAYPISQSNQTLGQLLMALFPGITAFSMGILALYIVIAMLGVDLTKFFGDESENNKIVVGILGALGVFVVIYYYGVGFGWWGNGNSGYFNWLIGPNGLLRDPFLYILCLTTYLFYWISKDNGNDNGNDNKKSK
jgi:hypothetical protein